MSPERHEIVNDHLVEEYVWGREMVVYVDYNRWDSSYESALRWATMHNTKWVYWDAAKEAGKA